MNDILRSAIKGMTLGDGRGNTWEDLRLAETFLQHCGPLLCLLSTGNEEELAIMAWLRKYKASITSYDISEEWKCSYFLGSHRGHIAR
jgi:hypothetical protein